MAGIFVHNCGATYSASSYAEQYAYDYGDNLELFLQNELEDKDKSLKQLTVDFEQELAKLNPLSKYALKDNLIGDQEEDNDDGVYAVDNMLIW